MSAPSTTAAPPLVNRGPLRRRRLGRALLNVGCVAVSLFMVIPIYLVAVASFSSRESLNRFPLDFFPADFSTETISVFLGSTGIVGGLVNSLSVALGTLVLALLLGLPAGYALARFAFPGKDAYQLYLMFTRALPIVVLSVPLAELFLTAGLYDTTTGVTLLHAALALPTSILITASVFVGVPRDVEEAARIFGCTPVQAFFRVVLPMALPGATAAAIFAFVLSWNEVVGAAILTLNHRTLPAQVLVSLDQSPLAYRLAGGFALVIPALVFIALMRRYLTNMWGATIR